MAKKRKSKKSKDVSSLIYIIAGILLIISLLFAIGFLNNKKIPLLDNPDDQEIIIEPKEKLNIVDLNSKSRNVAVMINNIRTVWGYQSGVQDAYIVYEIITEGGITRLMAIFRDVNPTRIGTIRSAREYYVDYVLENDAVYVHDGGSPQAISDMRTYGVTDLGTGGAWRDKTLGLSSEHTEFTSMEKIYAKISSKNVRATSDKDLLLNYSAKEIDLSSKDGAQVANNISISFSGSHTTSFVYDPDAKVYKRYQNNKEHKDYVTKEQYTVKNIITYQVGNSTYDYKGRQRLNNIGSGSGYFITDGYAVPITWEKSSKESQTVYKYLNGEEITLNDGNTHIEIQPINRTITIN
ncbi:MAG: DUF3048 domain-containing protein [Erysipelotrichales bacterium]|nr:DUF3048 domain-containing protein [Erysipelotrichales bacterium]